jgi:hypothetical protein
MVKYLKVFVRKFQVKTAFTFKVIKYESFFMKNNSLVIIYRFGSHKYFLK